TPETTGIIRNDDYPNIAITDTTLKEGDDDTTQATVTVSLSEPVNAEVTVDYDTEAGTAEADLDYVRVQGQLTFAPGETEKTIIVPINGETLVETDETFTVKLSNARNGHLIDDEAEITLENDDFVQISIKDVTVSEFNDVAKLTVTLSDASDAKLTVDYITEDETAKSGSDYIATNGTLTFLAGETSQTITIPLVDDLLPEATENFWVNLFNPSGSNVLADNQGIVTIEDNDDDIPVAWWRLDETTGIIAEDSIEDNDGLLQNGPTWIIGRVNGGLAFDGIDDFVNVTDDDVLDVGTENFSISAWVKIFDGSGIILDKRIQASGPVQGYALSHDNIGRLRFQMTDGTVGGGVNYLSTASIADGQWHHITVTVDRDDTQGGDFYIDGVQDGSFDPTTASGSLSNSRDLLFGRHSDSPTPNYFQGALDEVKLFKTALTDSEVLSLYESANDSGEDPNKNENGIPSNGIPDVFNPNVLTPDITASPVLEVETAENTTATEITESTFKSSASLENAEESTFSQSFLSGTSDVSALTDDEDLLGELNGQIWYDQNNNNTQEGDEPGLAGWVVFLDANGNAQFDPDEAFTVTDDKGDYAFTGLDAGTYRLAQVRHDGWVQTYPETEINGDFESGTFADWQTIGDYSIEPTAVDAPFKLGNYQAEITTDIDSVPVEDLEDFLGLTQGSLNTLAETFADSLPEEEIIRNTVTEGSAIAKTITVEAGDTLTFDWNFITFDYLYFMDFGFFSISSATDNTEILASVDTSYALSPADVSVETGLQSFSHTFTTSGEYTIGVGVVDAGDHIVDSALRLDNFTLTANEYSVELKDGESVDNLDFGNYLPGLPQTIQFAAANYSVTGEGTDAEITLTRSGDVSQSADVTVQLNSGTADGGSDFDAADKLVKFAPGETSKTFTIAILEDASAEDNEDFFLSLTSTSDAEIGAQSTATVTIIDTDTVVNFAQPTYQINEDGSAVGAEITVIRTGDRSSSSEVKLFFEDGTAIGGDPFVEFGEDKFGETTLELLFPEGVDFDQSKVESSTGEFISTRTVFFAPGEESQTVKFPIHDDDIREGTEFFNLYLLNTGDPLVSSQKRTEIQIIDNEGADITGSVWHDWNRNRHWDVGELGLSDWTVYIDANDNQQLDAEEISTVTDANGFYSFSGLEEGTYTIAEVLQEDWQQTFPGQDPGFVHRVSVNLGDEVTHVDFGNFNETLGEISGYKWHDRDRDGIWDDNEATLSGWMIYLDDNNNGELDPGEIATVTDAEGAYSFTGLKSDTYTVAEVMQPGWAQSYPFQNSTGSNAHTVFINPGEQVDKIDFGNFYTAADPVAWWRLDETAGIIADDSIGTNDGLLQNGPTWITGRVNGALSFDGIDDFVNVADDDVLDVGSDDFSLSAWVKIYDGSGIILDKRIQASGPAQGYVLSHTNNGRLNFQMADGTSGGGVSYLSTASIADGQWHHITVTVDRDDTQGGDFYIDGVKDGSFDPTMALGSLSNSRNLLFGRNSDSPTPNYFQGALDEVKLFKADLTASDVLSLYEDADKNNLHDPITAVSPISSTASNEILVSPEGDDLTNHNLPEPIFQPFSDSDVGSKVENDNSLVNPSEAPILGSVNLNQSHENSLINVGNDSLLPNMFGLLGQEGSDLAIMRQ
ncbi:MAG: Calx-beta domain-containing protein, partial [Cyanobacteria bacterium P01_F01_bin.86]